MAVHRLGSIDWYKYRKNKKVRRQERDAYLERHYRRICEDDDSTKFGEARQGSVGQRRGSAR